MKPPPPRWLPAAVPAAVPAALLVVLLAPSSFATPPHQHPRAVAAANRVRPDLERDLRAANLVFGDPVFLRAFKEEMLLEVFVRSRKTGRYEWFRAYPVAAASGALGPKLAEGDGQVPEGFYQVPPAAMNPASRFHLSFNIGYPNAFDRYHKRTGGHIMIHGNQVSIGCLAMTDPKIEEIFTLCSAAHQHGQRAFDVHIFPFRPTPERLANAAPSPWLPFWQNLRLGYLAFEKNHQPPVVTTRHGAYHFSSR